MWNNCTQYKSNELDKIQNKAARIVTGATKLASIGSFHTETGWEHCNLEGNPFYKVKMDFALIILLLLCLLLMAVRQHTLYVTLQIYKHYIKFSSLLYNFLPSAFPDWNELPEQTRKSLSLNIFKKGLKFNLITPL